MNYYRIDYYSRRIGKYTDACKAFVEANGGISEFDYKA